MELLPTIALRMGEKVVLSLYEYPRPTTVWWKEKTSYEVIPTQTQGGTQTGENSISLVRS